jgi:DNA mismatch repair ATPase MutS
MKGVEFARDMATLGNIVLKGCRSKLLQFDHETITDRQMKELKRFIKDPKFRPQSIKYKYQTITTLCQFVIVMYKLRLTLPKVRLKRQIDAIEELIETQLKMRALESNN